MMDRGSLGFLGSKKVSLGDGVGARNPSPFLSRQKTVRGHRTALSAQAAVEWAFHAEKASLDPVGGGVAPQPSSYGLEYVMIQQAKLGCKVDGGGYKPEGHYTAPEADMIAAMVAGIPQRLGGRLMALTLAECGRQRSAPDWMPGAVPRLEPVEWHAPNQHGRRAKSEVWETVTLVVNGKRTTSEVRFTPCRWVPSMAEIDYRRERYVAWRDALSYLADVMQEARVLTFDITGELPPAAPWGRG